MDNYIKNIIEERFASKKQQRLFYAKASDKSLPKKERKKWSKWAKEYSSDTDFEKIPDTVEKEVDEIVDEKGNISRKKIPITKSSKGSSRTTTDQAIKTSAGQMGTHGVHGTHTTLKYWAEADMSKALGFEKTMGQDKDIEDAEDYFMDDLGMGDNETDDRLSSYGYDEDLPGDKVRLIENPKKFVNDYVESVLKKRTTSDDLVKKDQNEDVDSELNPIIKRQVIALKNTLEKNNMSVKDVLDILKSDTETDE
jgi:hypothetical protein